MIFLGLKGNRDASASWESMETGSHAALVTGRERGVVVSTWPSTTTLVAAQWQLLQALRLYERSEDYYSVITLAGAAEEIFGKLSGTMVRGCALDPMKITIPMLSKRLLGKALGIGDVTKSLNRAKNWLKHGEGPLSFDARFEAEDMLDRAIPNCWHVITTVMNPSSDELTAFLLDAIRRYDDPDGS